MHSAKTLPYVVEKLASDSALLSYPELEQVTTIPRRSLQRLILQGKFPSPVAIPSSGEKSRRVAWPAPIVREWLEALQPAKVIGGSNE